MNISLISILVVVFLQCISCVGQGLGNGVGPTLEMDTCEGAAGPRPIIGVSSPGSTEGASIDDVNNGFCGVEINTPGIWWWVNGTGQVIRASSCDEGTRIKAKFSVFTGECGALRCVAGSDREDFDCPLLNRGEQGEWGSISTAVDFDTWAGQHYYILVQQVGPESGAVWMNFVHPELPRNDKCINAVGPVPRDLTQVEGTTEHGAVSQVDAGFCGIPDLYPGVWYQVMGTGGPVTVMACGEFNKDGFYFSVYNGAYCDSMSCVEGDYEINILDEEKCTFGAAGSKRPLTKYTFDTRDRDRYYIYVHFARTAEDKPTSPFRFFVDDGESGIGGTGGAASLLFEKETEPLEFGSGGGADGSDGSGNSDGDSDSKGKGKKSGASSTGVGLISVLGIVILLGAL